MKFHENKLLTAIAAVALMLAVGACSSSSDDDEVAGTPPATDDEMAGTPPATPPAMKWRARLQQHRTLSNWLTRPMANTWKP